MKRYELAELDFTHIENNQQVKNQGVVICIKTPTKGYFSLELERYVTRQDLANITVFSSFNMSIAKRILKNKKHLENKK